MTDNKDQTDKQASAPEDEVIELSEPGQTEEWQGELPPEDDFHDQGEFHDDLQEEIVEESETGETDEEHDAPVEKNNRGKVIFMGVIILGAALMAGLAYLQFGAGSADKSMGPLVPVSSVLDVHAIKDQKNDNAQTTASQTNTDGKAYPGPETQDLSGAKPISSVSSDVVSSNDVQPAEPTNTVDAPAIPPLPGMDKSVGVAKVETIPFPPKAPAAATDAPKPVEVADTAKTEQRLKELNDQIATLQKSLDETTQHNTALLAQVEELQKAQTQWEKDKAQMQSQVKEQAAQPEKAVVAPEKPVVKTASAHVKKTTPVKKKAVSARAPAWVLRAATPNAAWVASEANSSELQQVKVGETLKGIGKIKEIRQNGDRWEVVGTSGTLK